MAFGEPVKVACNGEEMPGDLLATGPEPVITPLWFDLPRGDSEGKPK